MEYLMDKIRTECKLVKHQICSPPDILAQSSLQPAMQVFFSVLHCQFDVGLSAFNM
jgi:hypothetical protein